MLRVIQHAELINDAASWVNQALSADENLTAYPQLIAAVEEWESAHLESSDYLEKN